MDISPGAWREHNMTDQIQPCVNRPSNCIGGKSNYLCQEGYTGALCEACDILGEINGNKYGREGDYECAECNSENSVFKILGVFLTLLISAWMVE